MIDFDAFTKLEGTVWAKEPELWLQPEARLVWWLAEHLAARCEMHVDPEDMAQADPGSLYFLKLAEEYLLALQTPRRFRHRSGRKVLLAPEDSWMTAEAMGSVSAVRHQSGRSWRSTGQKTGLTDSLQRLTASLVHGPSSSLPGMGFGCRPNSLAAWGVAFLAHTPDPSSLSTSSPF